jgi:hypothetical protein
VTYLLEIPTTHHWLRGGHIPEHNHSTERGIQRKKRTVDVMQQLEEKQKVGNEQRIKVKRVHSDLWLKYKRNTLKRNIYLHCKKRSLAGMSLTKLSLAGNNLIITCQGEFG